MNRSTTLHLIIVSAVTVAVLLPFLGRAYNMDDPLFLWTAQYILDHPFDFYGFLVNWYGYDAPIFEVMKNPPLGAYFIAGAGSIVGFGESALHAVFLIPAIGVATGTYMLARRFTTMALGAALTAVFTPAFLVSATTVMCDVLMLAFWVWAVYFWLKGTAEDRALYIFLSALLITFSALTKYFGISLIPLLIVYSLVSRKRPALWLPWLLLPIAVLAGYQWATDALYGRGLLLDAAAYTKLVRPKGGAGVATKAYTGLVFLGGSLITSLFCYIRLGRARSFLPAAVFFAASVAVLALSGGLGKAALSGPEGTWWVFIAELALFALAGVVLLLLSIGELKASKDSEAGLSLLLFLWIAGTLVFASFVNWSINVRSILPAAPAVAIVVWRALERRGESPRGPRAAVSLLAAVALTLTVTAADTGLANSARSAARYITANYSAKTETLWYQGHWGFQYYMDGAGARHIDLKGSHIKKGEIAARPDNNTNLSHMRPPLWSVLEKKGFSAFPLAATMIRSPASAGFYSSMWGPAPFVLGWSADELYYIARIEKDLILK